MVHESGKTRLEHHLGSPWGRESRLTGNCRANGQRTFQMGAVSGKVGPTDRLPVADNGSKFLPRDSWIKIAILGRPVGASETSLSDNTELPRRFCLDCASTQCAATP